MEDNLVNRVGVLREARGEVELVWEQVASDPGYPRELNGSTLTISHPPTLR